MPALLFARIEYPTLDVRPYLNQLDLLGREACLRVAAAPGPLRVQALNQLLFDELRFTGNSQHYGDPRNSFLNEVLDRRTGIPISLAVVYMEVARRAGLQVEGVNFPGHFLVRCQGLIIDTFHSGAILSEDACRVLLRRHEGEDATLEPHLQGHASKRQILARMLVNLKRIYVEVRSFPQAKAATDLLLVLDPMLHAERRDRGLLAYHLDDYAGALRDLEDYLRLNSWSARSEREEHDRIWQHVKTLRRRVAGLN